MSHLVNDLEAIVTEAVDGLILSSDGKLSRLDGFPDIKVVLRADWSKDRVALVSGGGAGHEPAHAGFVGAGLLTAAVCGEIFASPSVDAVLAAILAVTGDAGCLVIAKNYTGDRLAFGLAVERARSLGLNVEMVVVADDIALPQALQRRGLAGTLFVHKVAGALAERGAPLAEVAQAAQLVADGVKTLGVSLSSVSIPGRKAEERLAEGQAELGLGIHGEPGAFTIDITDSAALVKQMTTLLLDQLPEGPVAVLVNNLGGVAALEMGVVLRDVLDSELGSRTGLVVGPAALMTSLSAQGFSLSALPLGGRLIELLRAPAATHTSWPGARSTEVTDLHPVPALRRETATPSSNESAHALISAVSRDLINREAELNALDARVGDGDTGSTFAMAARRLLDLLDELPLDEPAALMTSLSTVLTTAMGGSSGVLGSIFFAAAGTALGAGGSLAQSLREGTLAMQRYGGASIGDRTMLDALIPAVDALCAGKDLATVAAAARQGAERTAAMTVAKAGRSAHVPAEHLDNVEDPGAVAVAAIFEALSRV